MHRFFVQPKAIENTKIILTDDNYKHIKTVLRLKPANDIMVCDGEGYDYHCRIKSIQDQIVETDIITKLENNAELPYSITLFQALPKSDKMDFVIEKAVELGVNEIIPIITTYTVVKANDEREQKKLKRWNNICEAAAKQSGRGRIPIVKNIHSYKDATDYSEGLCKCFIAYEKESEKTLKDVLNLCDGKTIGLFIGSEGGFSEDEIKIAMDKGIYSFSLGKRILRTETAALSAVSMINYELEL